MATTPSLSVPPNPSPLGTGVDVDRDSSKGANGEIGKGGFAWGRNRKYVFPD